MKIIFAVIICLFLSGCGDGVEISNREFAVMAGVDKEDGDFKFIAAAPLLNGEKVGEIEIETNADDSLLLAMNESGKDDGLRAYFGQTKAVVFGEELLRDSKSFKEAVETLLENREINLRTIVLGGVGSAEEIIGAAAEKKNDYGLFFWEYYKNISGKTDTYKMTINDISMKKEKGYVLPKTEIVDGKIEISGGIVMDGYEFKGVIDKKAMESLLLVNGDIKGAVIGGERIKSIKRKIDFLNDDNLAVCGINIFIKVEKSLNSDFSALENELSGNVLSTLRLIYDGYETDAWGLYERLYKFEPKMAGKKLDFDVNVFITE